MVLTKFRNYHLHFEREPSMSDSFKIELLLKSPECVAIQEDLLDKESSWGRVLSSESLRNLIFENQAFSKILLLKKFMSLAGAQVLSLQFLMIDILFRQSRSKMGLSYKHLILLMSLVNLAGSDGCKL